jgi:hypothetical protein
MKHNDIIEVALYVSLTLLLFTYTAARLFGWELDSSSPCGLSLHVVGVFASLFAVLSVEFRVREWRNGQRRTRLDALVSASTGVMVSEIESPERARKIHDFLAKRYSDELFRNRASDLISYINFIINIVGWACSTWWFLYVVFGSLTSESTIEGIEIIWGSIGVLVLSKGIQLFISFLSEFFVGRLPGEARAANRKINPRFRS